MKNAPRDDARVDHEWGHLLKTVVDEDRRTVSVVVVGEMALIGNSVADAGGRDHVVCGPARV